MKSSLQEMAFAALFATVVVLANEPATAQAPTDAQRRAAAAAELAVKQKALDAAQANFDRAYVEVRITQAQKSAAETDSKAAADMAKATRHVAELAARTTSIFDTMVKAARDTTAAAEIDRRVFAAALKELEAEAAKARNNSDLAEAVKVAQVLVKVRETKVVDSRKNEADSRIVFAKAKADQGEARKHVTEQDKIVAESKDELAILFKAANAGATKLAAAKATLDKATAERDAAKAVLDKIPPA